MPSTREYLVDVRTPDGDWRIEEDCVSYETALDTARRLVAAGESVEVWCKDTDTLVWSGQPNRPPAERIYRQPVG